MDPTTSAARRRRRGDDVGSGESVPTGIAEDGAAEDRGAEDCASSAEAVAEDAGPNARNTSAARWVYLSRNLA
jgi:hypothetical protein